MQEKGGGKQGLPSSKIKHRHLSVGSASPDPQEQEKEIILRHHCFIAFL